MQAGQPFYLCNLSTRSEIEVLRFQEVVNSNNFHLQVKVANDLKAMMESLILQVFLSVLIFFIQMILFFVYLTHRICVFEDVYLGGGRDLTNVIGCLKCDFLRL